MRLSPLLILAIFITACGTKVSATQPTPGPTKIPQFNHYPAMTINTSATYTASVVTTDGAFSIKLLPKVAPIAVNSFVFLARHDFFNGVIFHRIVKNFVIQTGDPTGTGYGGPGYHFKTEPVHRKYTWGTVAMANSGADTNGSQFFIVTAKQVGLPPKYTIFGEVTSGRAAIEKLNDTPTMLNPGTGEDSMPANAAPAIKSVTIHVSH